MPGVITAMWFQQTLPRRTVNLTMSMYRICKFRKITVYI